MRAETTSRTDRQTRSVIAGYAAAGAFWGTFAASLPALRDGGGLGTGDFGLLLFALTAGAFPAMVLLARTVHRLGRIAMPGSLALFAVGAASLASSGALPGLVASFVLIGAGSGALDIAMNLRVSQLEDATGRSLFNVAHAAFPLALLVSSASAGAARGAGIDPAALFALLSVVLLVAGLVELRCAEPAAEVLDTVAPVPRGRRIDRVLLLLGIAAALAAFAEMAAQSWSAIYVESVLGASPTAAGIAFSVFTAGLGLGRLAAHALDARVPARTLVPVASGVGVAAFVLLGASTGLAAAMSCLLVGGMAVGPVEPAVFRTVSARHGAAARGPVLGLVTAVAYLGYLASPPILGAIAEGAGWTALWWTVAVGVAGTAFAFRAASESARRTGGRGS